MPYSVKLIAILAPIIIVQYGLSLFCLLKLVFLDQPIKRFVVWNIFILVVVGVGVTTFLICYFCFRDRVFPPKKEEEKPQDKQDTFAATEEKPQDTFAAEEKPQEKQDTFAAEEKKQEE